MNPSIDDIFEQVTLLSSQIAALEIDDPQRLQLVEKRARLRSEAQRIAGASRHPKSVETEMEMLLSRLAEIDALFVTKGYAEKHLTKGFSDPGAYSANINRKLADDHAAEIMEIEERIAELANIQLAEREL